jgi:hypothetical protein
MRQRELKSYHVILSRSGWKVSVEDVSREPSRHPTKEAAVAEATQLARAAEAGEVIVHRPDGSIETQYSFDEGLVRR